MIPESRQIVAIENFAGEPEARAFMALDAGKYLDREIQQYGLMEPDLTRFLRDALKREMVCVDVGANIGYYTLLFARECRRVLAFEPVAGYRAVLERTIAANALTNVEVYACGLSDQASTARISVGECSATLHWVAPPTIAPRPEAIELRRLDDVVTMPIDLVKIDVDGHEMGVLDGALATLRRDRPLIVFEVSAPHYREAGVELVRCHRFFESLDYVVACEDAPAQALNREAFLARAADETRSWNFIASPA